MLAGFSIGETSGRVVGYCNHRGKARHDRSGQVSQPHITFFDADGNEVASEGFDSAVPCIGDEVTARIGTKLYSGTVTKVSWSGDVQDRHRYLTPFIEVRP